jgi:hypothetical protein
MIFGLIEEDLLRLSMEKQGKSKNSPCFFISPKEDWKAFYLDLSPKLLIIQTDNKELLEEIYSTQIPVVYITENKPIKMKEQDEHIVPPVSFKKVAELLNRAF